MVKYKKTVNSKLELDWTQKPLTYIVSANFGSALNLESLNCFSQVEKRTCSCTRVAQEGLGKKGGDSSCLKIRGRGTPGASENKR